MAISLGNRAKMSTSTTGTGTITLGSAVSGFQTFEGAGITNGQTVRYAIEDGTAFEIGSGVYTSSGTTLTRSVTESSNSDSAITLTGNAQVFVTATVADLYINDGASTLTTTGVITGGTVEATSDTAAGDNAAMGYTSAEGLILTGQGSTNDITIKNDADTAVISIPTGGTNVDFVGSIDVANVGISTGVIDLKNGGSQSVVKFYCEESNAHYAEIKAPAHGSFSGNVTLTLPATTDTIAGIAATQTFTNKTLTAPKINEDVAVTTTATEINLIDGGTSRGTTAVASGDGILINDAGTMRMTNVDTVSTYFSSHSVGGGNIVTTGALNSGSITSGFGAIDNGSSNITTTGVGSFGSLDISGNIDVDGTTNLDAVDIDGAVNVAADLTIASTNKILFNDASQFIQGSSATVLTIAATDEIDLTATTIDINGAVALNGAITGATNITLSGELDAATGDFSGDVDVDGTLEADAITIGGTALATVIAGTTVTNATNSAHVLVTDNESTNEENLIAFVEGATSSTGNVGLEMDGNFSYNPSTGTVSATVFKGNIDAVDGDFDGTLEADAITIGGTAVGSIFSPIAGGTGIVTTGALDAGSITSGFGAINNGSSAITTTGVGTFGSLDISGNIDVDGTTNLDAVDIDGAVQLDATLTVGVDDTGYDVKFFGDAASAFMQWDASADDLILGGAAGLIVPEGQFTLGSTAVTSTAAEINQLDAITRGSILYGNASGATARLAKGSANTVLTSDGTDISWAAASGGGSPAGTVIYYAANSAPTGFLKANGAAVSRSTYSDLFSAISTTFGAGDGSSTFNVPDLRGEFMRGWDDSRGIDSGRSFGSAQADELESHLHQAATYSNIVGWSGTSPGNVFSNNFSYQSAGAQNTGSTGGSETRPRNIALLACIKY